MNNTEQLKKTIGKNILKLRNKREISQQTLSRQVGISQPHISCIERGKSELNAVDFLRIAEFFQVTPKSLYKGAQLT